MWKVAGPLWVACLVGCGDAGSPQPVARVEELVRSDARLQRLVRYSALRAQGGGAQTVARRGDDARVVLPSHAGDFVELRDGERSRPLLRVRTLHTASAPLRLERGIASYSRALAGGDLIWLAHGGVAEQLWLVTSPGPRETVLWELCPRSDLRVRGDGDAHELVFENRNGDARVRIPSAYALDVRGRRRGLTRQREQDATGCVRLRFELDAAGLEAPLVIDPAFEAVTWVKKTFPSSAPLPPARLAHGMAYDPVRKKVVVFGGQTTWDPDPYFSDTWEYDGVAWQQVTTATGPDARRDFAMAYSPLHGGVVLHGGVRKNSSAAGGIELVGDSWLYDGDWSKLPAGADDPPGLFAHAMAFDTVRSVLVLFGGSTDVNNENVWELSLSGWKKSTVASTPGPQNFFAMTFHAALGSVVTYGGLKHTAFPDLVEETWTFNGTNWLELPGTNPPGRWQVRLSYDSKRKRALAFGGYDGFVDLDETWELLDDGTWALRPTLTSPFARSDAGLAYDVARDRTVLFGGYTAFEYDETWEYQNFGNSCTTVAQCDGYPCVDGVCCSVTSCPTCQACSPATGKCEPVTGTDDPDSCTGTNTCDPTGVCKKSNGQSCQSGAECASAHCADGVCCNQACQSACESCVVDGKLGSCSFVIGEAAHGSCPGTGPCGATCDGTQAICTYTALGTDCGSSCESATRTERSCDGVGACSTKSPVACPDHLACADATSCASECGDDEDCASGYRCENAACVEKKNVCVDEVTGKSASGVVESCLPFRCKGDGCLSACDSTQDCASGFLCDEKSRCSRPPPDEPADEGCNCRSAGGSGAQPLWLLLALLALRRRTAA